MDVVFVLLDKGPNAFENAKGALFAFANVNVYNVPITNVFSVRYFLGDNDHEGAANALCFGFHLHKLNFLLNIFISFVFLWIMGRNQESFRHQTFKYYLI